MIIGVGLLAPVPAVILKSALATCSAEGCVAFGTNACEVFVKLDLEYGAGLPVLIDPTPRYRDPNHLCAPGFWNFRGIYSRTQRPRGGKHPNPALRPAATVEGDEPDTGWALFWEIAELVQLPKADRIAITSLTADGQKKAVANGFVPHGPMLAKAAFL
jgi:hypothetical protein